MVASPLSPMLPGTYQLGPQPQPPAIPNPHNLPSSPGTLRYWRKWAIEVNASLKNLSAEYNTVHAHNYRPPIDQQGDPKWMEPIRQQIANFAEQKKVMWKIEKTLEMRERARRHLDHKGWDIDTDPFIEGTSAPRTPFGGENPGHTWNETRPETKKELRKKKHKHHGTHWHAQVGGHIHVHNSTTHHGSMHHNGSENQWLCVPMDPKRQPFHLTDDQISIN